MQLLFYPAHVQGFDNGIFMLLKTKMVQSILHKNNVGVFEIALPFLKLWAVGTPASNNLECTSNNFTGYFTLHLLK
jgi:hypothetical protein